MPRIVIKENELKSIIENVLSESTDREGVELSKFIISHLNGLLETIKQGGVDINYVEGYLGAVIARSNEKLDKISGNRFISDNIDESKKVGKKQKKFDKVMHEFGKRELKSSNGEKVTDEKQALAIAYSESDLDNDKKLKESVSNALRDNINLLISNK
jgi:hypothetical protein